MDMMKFFETAMKLKEVERTGWVERGVQKPETSSDHSFMVALMALILGREKEPMERSRQRTPSIDMEKALKMSIIHDLPEAIVGDIITKENWEKGGSMWESEKISKERPAVRKLSSLAGDPEILRIWEEFEAQKTPEARFVKDLDRLATIIQAMEYHMKGNYKKPLPPFWDGKGISSIKDPGLRKFLDSVLKRL